MDSEKGFLSVNPHRSNWSEADGDAPASLILVPTLPLQLIASATPQSTEFTSESAIEASTESNAVAHSRTSIELTPNPIWLTDELLFHHQRCRRRSFLDLYGDPAQRDRPSDYLAKLRQDSIEHRAQILLESPTETVYYPREDWLAGAAATLTLMQQGCDRIANGVLVVELAKGVHLVSRPDLLIKQEGRSRFGDWLYAPTDIRLGKRPKQDYQVIAAYHAYLLALVQEAWSETSWLFLRQRGAYAVTLAEVVPRMHEILLDCVQTLVDRQTEPEVFIAHSRCDLCPWYTHCYGIAQAETHLSLLPGVTPSRYIHLKERQLTTLEALAIAPPHQLESLPGFGPQVAHRLVKQAQATLHNQALVHHLHPTEPPPHRLFTTEELPTAAIELYFDIEAAPEHNLIYLHGVLVVDRQQQTETFHPLLAEQIADEQTIWQQFLELVWSYPTAPIFHFCPYEVQTIHRLGNLYGTPNAWIDPVVARCVDLHERVTRVAILPVESYALKPIARWIGFDWRDTEANGAQAICWYDQWLTTGDRSHLEAIVRYNEDDCRATYHVKDWLVEFNQAHSRTVRRRTRHVS